MKTLAPIESRIVTKVKEIKNIRKKLNSVAINMKAGSEQRKLVKILINKAAKAQEEFNDLYMRSLLIRNLVEHLSAAN
jgi:hypothetical protein